MSETPVMSADPDVPAERLREVLRLFTPSEIGPAAARALYELSIGMDPMARLRRPTLQPGDMPVIYPSDVPSNTAALPVRPGPRTNPRPRPDNPQA